jgi:hypothetical protein
MEENLRPSFGDIPKVKTPKKVLMEQAFFLEKNTSNLLKAEITSGNTSSATIKSVHNFVIRAPFLGNYNLTLFRLSHDPVFIYPAELITTLKSQSFQIPDEGTLVKVLKSVFSDTSTLAAISNLLIQSKASAEDDDLTF